MNLIKFLKTKNLYEYRNTFFFNCCIIKTTVSSFFKSENESKVSLSLEVVSFYLILLLNSNNTHVIASISIIQNKMLYIFVKNTIGVLIIVEK